ncbi:hypothetical protein CYY_005674 [Polysphondylium violaceum]|uniref:Uncharacterized protein n=1 Tax=Polysphondylium violaceum TaxID=133409 RepID=A0A8J4PTE4_9MYCE|nr:hypothetical protein CYY_005674 [Polysphondylium violaceum]
MSMITVDILTPAFHFPSTFQRSEILSLCRSNIGVDDLEFIPINNDRIGMIIKDSNFSMETVEGIYWQNYYLFTQLSRATESLLYFQDKHTHDQETIASLKKEIAQLKKSENDLIVKLEEQSDKHRLAEASTDKVILDLQQQLSASINIIKSLSQLKEHMNPLNINSSTSNNSPPSSSPVLVGIDAIHNSTGNSNINSNSSSSVSYPYKNSSCSHPNISKSPSNSSGSLMDKKSPSIKPILYNLKFMASPTNKPCQCSQSFPPNISLSNSNSSSNLYSNINNTNNGSTPPSPLLSTMIKPSALKETSKIKQLINHYVTLCTISNNGFKKEDGSNTSTISNNDNTPVVDERSINTNSSNQQQNDQQNNTSSNNNSSSSGSGFIKIYM